MKILAVVTRLYWIIPLVFCSLSSGNDVKVFEALPHVPSSWHQGDRAPPSQILKLRLAIEQPRTSEFEDHVVGIATPGHPLYGQHLSRNEVKAFLEPEPEVSAIVTTWLQNAGVLTSDIVDDGNWLTLQMNVSLAEHILDTQFYRYTHGDTTVIRTLQYSLPALLHHCVRMIQPTTRFSVPAPQHNSMLKVVETTFPPNPLKFDLGQCNSSVTPACLRTQYQIDNFTATYHPKNKLGISGYLEQYASYADLSFFGDAFAPYMRASNFSFQGINGGLNLQNSSLDSTEANLDVQYGLAVSVNVNTVFYSTAGRGLLKPDLDEPDAAYNLNEPYLDQLLYLLDLPDEDLPTVLSTSYSEDEQSVPATYANVTCNLFAQLGARGVSVIFASGDSGVGNGCQTNDGRNATRFMPTFPASCPFVTSVGGTHNVAPERAAYLSAGGFSDRFPRPVYQEEAVGEYLAKLGDRWKGLYNPRGRGIPDVSARSLEYYIYDHGRPSFVSGTSCAAPVFAGIVANLNSIRLNVGLPSLGFLNPFLYTYGVAGLTDITEGGSRGCTGIDLVSGLPGRYIPYASWNATEGWDPVTGLGTPIFPKLIELMFEHTVPGKISG